VGSRRLVTRHMSDRIGNGRGRSDSMWRSVCPENEGKVAVRVWWAGVCPRNNWRMSILRPLTVGVVGPLVAPAITAVMPGRAKRDGAARSP
jgi:hypothetical protein